MGIEPTSEAWEVLNKTLKAIDLAALSFSSLLVIPSARGLLYAEPM
jgi:hypothetical protein